MRRRKKGRLKMKGKKRGNSGSRRIMKKERIKKEELSFNTKMKKKRGGERRKIKAYGMVRIRKMKRVYTL